jgi:hypothetical protein
MHLRDSPLAFKLPFTQAGAWVVAVLASRWTHRFNPGARQAEPPRLSGEQLFGGEVVQRTPQDLTESRGVSFCCLKSSAASNLPLPPNLGSTGGRGTGRQYLRFRGVNLLAGHEINGGCPGGKQIEAGNEFRRQRGKKRPMPSQQPYQNYCRHGVEQNIRRRQASWGKKRQGSDLDGIHYDCHQPSQPMLRRLDRLQKIKQPHKNSTTEYSGEAPVGASSMVNIGSRAFLCALASLRFKICRHPQPPKSS